MIARIFRRNQPALFFAMAAVAPALWFASPGAVVVPNPDRAMPLFRPLVMFAQAQPWSATVMGLLLTLGCALQLVALANDAELFERPNQLAALLFPLLLALGPTPLHLDAALAGLPFVLWALRQLWVTTKRNKGLGPLFDGGVLIGVAALFYLPYAFLVVVIWAGNAVMRPFHWRDQVIPLVGSVSAFYLCWGAITLLDAPWWHPMATLIREREVSRYAVDPAFAALLIGSGVLLALAGVLAFARSYGQSIMREKNIRSASLAFTAACLVLVLFEALLNRVFPNALMATPLALFVSYPLLQAKRVWLADIAGWGLMGLAFWAQWGLAPR